MTLKAPFPYFGIVPFPWFCYNQYRKDGADMGRSTEERFWGKVQKTETCWLWTGGKRSKGYGAFVYARDGEPVQGRAHVYSYELHKGRVPKGVFVLHTCDTPACVNPDHLFLGNNQDNVDDMIAKGRHVRGGTYSKGKYQRGELHHGARLTATDVQAIRAAYNAGGVSFSQLARKYGLALGHVFRIVKKKAWRHVE